MIGIGTGVVTIGIVCLFWVIGDRSAGRRNGLGRRRLLDDCGGLLEAKKIAAMAEAYYVGVAPHNPLGPIANAAALQFALSTPNFLIQEDMLADVPWRWEVVESSLKTENGYWLPCDAPGLGVTVNETAAAKHLYVQEPLQSVVYAADGAVLDW